MTRPMATARPPIDIRLIEPWKSRRNTNVGMTASGSVDGGNQRQPHVAKEHDQDDDGEEAADQDGVAHVGDRVADELGEVVDLGDVDARRQRRRERRRAPASTPCLTARMFAPICCEMLIETASRPLPVTSSVRSGEPGVTSPDVRHADGRAVLDDDRRVGDLLGDVHRPEASDRCCCPPSRKRPTGTQLVLRLQRIRDVGDRQAGGGQLRRDRARPRSRACRWPALRSARRRARAPVPACTT